MFRRTFKLTYRPMKNNFVLLPQHYFDLVSTYENGCLSLSTGKVLHYVTWAPSAGPIKDTEIGMNARVAKEIGLSENDLVKVALVENLLPIRSVYVTPVTSKDWEIIELSSEQVQTTLLDQTRVINSTQILVVWINRSMQVNFTVDKLRPNISYGRLDNQTEIIVAPKLQSNSVSQTNGHNNHHESPAAHLSRSKTFASTDSMALTPLSRSTTTSNALRSNPKTNHPSSFAQKTEKLDRLIKDLKRENSRTFEFRVIPGKWESGQISDVFVTRSNLPEFMDLSQVYLLKTVDEQDYYVNVIIVSECESFPKNIHRTIEVNENLMQLLKINELQKVTLRPKQTVLNFIEKIDLYPDKKTNYKIVERAFKNYVIEKAKLYPLLLNQDQIVRLDDDLTVTVKITPEHFPYCLINEQILKECKIYAADLVKRVSDLLDIEPRDDTILSVVDLISIKKFDGIVEKFVEQIKLNLCLDERSSVLKQGHFLIAGPASSGKTVLVERILEKLLKKPFCCHYDMFYCTRSKGRKVESVQKDLRQIFTTALNSAPSIVVLENLDVLVHSVGDQQTPDGEYYNRVADAVQHLIVEFTSNNPIAVIATVANEQSLNTRLHSPRGRHIFQTIAKIPELAREDRETILKELCSHIDSEKLNLEKFANLTEGYNFGDLVQFVERGIFYAYRMNQMSPVLSNDMLVRSLENTNSYCLQGIENHSKNNGADDDDDIEVSSIAGLESVVTVLEEVLMWPSKFPSIFDESPLRNQAGVLLFGPPGTGKTFLVSQIAKSWNLRIISVKGPELLAKYIGQSEENVRNLFNRARSAKPCLLFFDEFDSLAPKRGHDSTGVTDRVVNQLLTELDGVEGLSGVTVVAATSRPELLDPALLRSGRIDRLVECQLPNVDARLGIFKMLSRSLLLHKSVDLKSLAERTEGYTGADIQSLLTTANMTAVKEVLSKTKVENLPDKIEITQTHLLDAFNSTRSSLSPMHIAKYQHTYARFTNKEKQPREFVAQRATLA